jgi:putative flavoprotein involved in K+ transport
VATRERVGERTVVVGAGPCGLALARQLRHQCGIDALVVDGAAGPASSWRRLYDDFRLNTCGYWSHLPGQRIPRRHGRWPSRDGMVDYFEDYVRRQGLRLRTGVTVARLDHHPAGWRLATDDGMMTAATVVVATGNHHTPRMPPWPGAHEFTGELLHSVDYRNAGSSGGRRRTTTALV